MVAFVWVLHCTEVYNMLTDVFVFFCSDEEVIEVVSSLEVIEVLSSPEVIEVLPLPEAVEVSPPSPEVVEVPAPPPRRGPKIKSAKWHPSRE